MKDETEFTSCKWLEGFLSYAVTLILNGYLAGEGRDLRFDDMLQLGAACLTSARKPSRLVGAAVSLLIDKVPEFFTSEDLALASRVGFSREVPYDEIKAALMSSTPQCSVVGALRAASEAPFARGLRRYGLTSVDDCVRADFDVWPCQNLGDASLLYEFYRHRSNGLPQTFVEQFSSIGRSDWARASGRLAVVDRLRSLGFDPSLSDRASARDALLLALAPSGSIEASLPLHGPPLHLVWHLLDKLCLPQRVPVKFRDLRQSMNGNVIHPQEGYLNMSVLPDRDLVSDSLRFKKKLHCPSKFGDLLEQAFRDSLDGRQLVVVEVGGFLGDCALWAAASAEHGRLRLLEIEPVMAATARLKNSLESAGVVDSVDILTEALGDGAVHEVRGAIGTGTELVNPNFGICSNANASSGSSGDLVGLSPSRDTAPCMPRRLRTLDEVLGEWPVTASTAAGRSVDLLRVKTGNSAHLILAGLKNHLAAGRVHRLLVEECWGKLARRLWRLLRRYGYRRESGKGREQGSHVFHAPS